MVKHNLLLSRVYLALAKPNFVYIKTAGSLVDNWLHELLFVDPFSQTEVTQSSIFVIVQKDILRLNISVYNFVLVQVANCLEYLSVNFPLESLVHFKGVLFQKLFKSLTITELHLNVQDVYALLRLILFFLFFLLVVIFLIIIVFLCLSILVLVLGHEGRFVSIVVVGALFRRQLSEFAILMI